jgi:hypothetical protein
MIGRTHSDDQSVPTRNFPQLWYVKINSFIRDGSRARLDQALFVYLVIKTDVASFNMCQPQRSGLAHRGKRQKAKGKRQKAKGNGNSVRLIPGYNGDIVRSVSFPFLINMAAL